MGAGDLLGETLRGLAYTSRTSTREPVSSAVRFPDLPILPALTPRAYFLPLNQDRLGALGQVGGECGDLSTLEQR